MINRKLGNLYLRLADEIRGIFSQQDWQEHQACSGSVKLLFMSIGGVLRCQIKLGKQSFDLKTDQQFPCSFGNEQTMRKLDSLL